jgi:hypothetical protein
VICAAELTKLILRDVMSNALIRVNPPEHAKFVVGLAGSSKSRVDSMSPFKSTIDSMISKQPNASPQNRADRPMRLNSLEIGFACLQHRLGVWITRISSSFQEIYLRLVFNTTFNRHLFWHILGRVTS